MGLVMKYKSQYYFFILGKTNDRKKPYFEAILAKFGPIWIFQVKYSNFVSI